MENLSGEKKPTAVSTCEISFSAIEDALYVIGGKWKLKVIIVLQQNGAKRFNELQRMLPGISPRVLSSELKDLELNGFIKRNVYPDKSPVVVEYVLTDYSLTLRDIVKALWEWGVEHKKMIKSTI